MATLNFYGSHGEFTACSVSGHIIESEKCDCDDCAKFGGYETIALVDVLALSPGVLAHGGGDILDAPLIYRDGGYLPALCASVDGDIREEIAGLLPSPAYLGA